MKTKTTRRGNDFSELRIKIASPESILALSYGEVIKPETIN